MLGKQQAAIKAAAESVSAESGLIFLPAQDYLNSSYNPGGGWGLGARGWGIRG